MSTELSASVERIKDFAHFKSWFCTLDLEILRNSKILPTLQNFNEKLFSNQLLLDWEKYANDFHLSTALMRQSLPYILNHIDYNINNSMVNRPDKPILIVGAGNIPLNYWSSLVESWKIDLPILLKVAKNDFILPALLKKFFNMNGFPNIFHPFYCDSETTRNIISYNSDQFSEIIAYGSQRITTIAKNKSSIQLNGPKCSLGILTREAFQKNDWADNVANDISLFDQNGCHSLSWLFLEDDLLKDQVEINHILQKLSTQLLNFQKPAFEITNRQVETQAGIRVLIDEMKLLSITHKKINVLHDKNLSYAIIFKKEGLQFKLYNQRVIFITSVQDLSNVWSSAKERNNYIGCKVFAIGNNTDYERDRFNNLINLLAPDMITKLGNMQACNQRYKLASQFGN